MIADASQLDDGALLHPPRIMPAASTCLLPPHYGYALPGATPLRLRAVVFLDSRMKLQRGSYAALSVAHREFALASRIHQWVLSAPSQRTKVATMLTAGPLGVDAVRVRLFPSERDVTVSASVLTEPGAPARPSARVSRDAAHPSSDQRSFGGHGRSERGSATGGGTSDRPKSSSECHFRHEVHGQGGSGRDRAGYSRPVLHQGDTRERESQRGASPSTGARSGGRKSWLREGIRVRVVSKHVGRGKVYLAKAWLTAVVTVGECHIILDDGSVVEVCFQLLPVRYQHHAGHCSILAQVHSVVDFGYIRSILL